jgi:hypothetical protein
MNAKRPYAGNERGYGARATRSAWLMASLSLGLAVLLVIALRGAPGGSPVVAFAQPAFGTSAINNHLYVPCSVNQCDPARATMVNNHLYVPCSVGGCGRATVMNDRLYIPCSVDGCNGSR